MSATPGLLLQRTRVFGTRFFHRFGIHCATHQIRLIIISSIVISCLLFPAVALYSSTRTSPFSFSFKVFDALLTPDDISTYFALEEVRNLWDGYDGLHVREDSIARARCGKGGILRVERIIVHDGFQAEAEPDEPASSLTRKIFESTLKFEQRLSDLLVSQRALCIRSSRGRCLVLSPLAFWNYDEASLIEDKDLYGTLSDSRNVSIHGITVTSDMILAGREDEEFDRSAPLYPVLTYFFPETDCVANTGHHAWLGAVDEAASTSNAETIVMSKAPRLIALEYEKEINATPHLSALNVLTYTAYLIFLVYFTNSMRRMDKVHSRIGLAFTGLIEIVISTITSLSVCALAGFRITMVPWEIFPIIVIFIGVENMFSIVDAVVKTSITLPVKERIAEGLSRAGTSNTLKLCSYNAVLGVIAFFSAGAIRQFCAFAIVVLVAHWFLVHTFFVTVLSIDIQRLELDELLRQDESLAPSLSRKQGKESVPVPRTSFGRFAKRIHMHLHGRAAKNSSLVLLLAVTATLYYMTQPHGGTKIAPGQLLPHSRQARVAKPVNMEGVSPAMHIWNTLNPVNYGLVHLRIESPTVVVLNPEGTSESSTSPNMQHMRDHEKSHRSRWARMWTRTSRQLSWALKIIVFPTFVTTSLLYGLLLHLLKDAELLEAQRNRLEKDTPVSEDTIPAVEDPVSFTTLPRALATDVDLIAASADGSVVATVGLQNEFLLWRMDIMAYSSVDTTDLLLGSSGTSQSPASMVTAIGMNDRGTFVAVGTGTGVIGLWSISQNRIQPLPHLNADTSSAVRDIHFRGTSPATTGRMTPRRTSGATLPAVRDSDPPGCIYVTYDNGTVIRWTIGSFSAPIYIKPTRPASVIKSMILPTQADGGLLIGFSLEDGNLELCDAERSDGILGQETCHILAGNPADLVERAHVCCVELEGETRTVVSAATQAGVVSLWDAITGECMRVLDEPFGSISDMRVMPVPMKRCATCKELPPESFTLCFSFAQVVLFYRAYLSLPTRRCSCPLNRPKVISSVIGRRSRSNSVASVGPSSGSSSPAIVRSRMSSFSSSTAFDSSTIYPVSVHGGHSRRSSDKRNLDTYIPAEVDESYVRQSVGPQDIQGGSPFLGNGKQRGSLWDNLVVVCTADATFERGSWAIADNKIIGIRRRSRTAARSGKVCDGRVPSGTPSRNDSNNGLTVATLERWELWTFDPSESRLQASSLLALNDSPKRTEPGKVKASESSRRTSNPLRDSPSVVPRLHFTRVSPLFSSRSFCLAGFGNTVGLFNFGGSAARHRTSIDHLRSSSGGGKANSS